jgi:phospho-N-acetylmuramoyl-pentapeptide-transferase
MNFLLSMLISYIFGRLYIHQCQSLRVGHTVRVSEVKSLLNEYKKPDTIPSMGGLFVNVALIICALLLLKITPILAIILFTLSAYGLLGLFDDLGKSKKKEMRASTKFIGQVVIASISVYALTFFLPQMNMLYIPFMKDPVALSLYFTIPLMVFVIVAASNSVNLSDGLDGLAAGCSLFVFFTFLLLNTFVFAANEQMMGVICLILGSYSGFLALNHHPAKVFMGDTGSLSLGALMGLVAVILRAEFYLALVGLIFVFEALSVMIQVVYYRRYKKRVFLCAPLHHHFQMKGMHEKRVVELFYLFCALITFVTSGWLVWTYA